MEADLETGEGIQMVIGGDAITGVRLTNQNPLTTGQINYENISFLDNEFSSNPLPPSHDDLSHREDSSPRNVDFSHFQSQTFDAVTNFIVPLSQKVFFQKWLVESYDEVSAFKGFVSRHVHEIAERDGYQEFVAVILFRSYQTFKDWYTSPERSNLFKQLKKHRIQWSMMNTYGGNIEDIDPHDHMKPTNRINLQNSMVKIPKSMPPPKWKLTIVLIVSIYVLVVPYMYSGQSDILFQLGLPKSLIFFVFVSQLVIVNVYALAPLVMEISFVDRWLRIRRSDPESMHPIHAVLDQGLKMFAVKISPPPHPDLIHRLDTLERKIEKLREVEHNLKLSIQASTSSEFQPLIVDRQGESHISSIRNIESSLEYVRRTENRQTSNSDIICPNNAPNNHKISMAVRHYVKWECVLEFEDWTNKMEAEMSKWPGFLGFVRIHPQKEGEPFINSFSFDSPEHFIAFSKSPDRLQLLNELTSMLEATSASEISQERVFNDAFTELFVATGGSVKSRPPPLWKTTILTIIPLHLEVWFIGGNLQEYFIQAGLDPYLIGFIKLSIHITVNSYIGVPLMFSQFGEWVHMERPVKPLGYLSFLDKGLPNRWARIATVVLYIGLNLLGGFLNLLKDD